MKTKFNGILTLLIAFMVQFTFAQERTISGVVSDDLGPVSDITVKVRGTDKGTVTDFDGNYSIKAKTGDVIDFTHVSYTSSEVIVGASNDVNVTMGSSGVGLDEVVVTAQGIRKEAKSLGYAVTKLKSDIVEAKPVTDLTKALRGEVAGLNITSTTGALGSAVNATIRGFTSITGSNQPLYVVDGIPLDTGANKQSEDDNFLDNINQTSRSADIDPNNIESVNILKGLAASVLYGSAGRNGVILITTKSGSGKYNSNNKMSVNVSSSTYFSKAHLPNYQDTYGGGFSQRFGFFVSNWGPRFDEANSAVFGSSFIRNEGGTNIIVNPLTNLGDQSLLIGVDIAPEYVYKPYNSVEDFFNTGVSSTQSVNIRGGGEKSSFNATFSTSDNEGILPENTLVRNNFGVGGRVKLDNNFSVSGSMNYSTTKVKSPPIAAANGGSVGTFGNSSSVYANLIYTPRHIDLFNLPFQAVDGRSVYYRSGNDIQNPRWTAANAKTSDDTNRINGVANVTYQFNEKSSITFRSALDNYNQFHTNGQNKGGVAAGVTGFYRTFDAKSTVFDNTLSFSSSYSINDDNKLQYTIGATGRNEKFERHSQTSTDQLAFGNLRHFNFVNQSARDFITTQNTLGIYADLTYDYKGYAYINASVRNDWASTLESANNSIPYFALSGSLILTNAFENLKSKNLNYLKLRVGFGQSANYPGPYNTRNTLSLTARDFVDSNGNVISTNTYGSRVGNADLKPELSSEIEVGVDTRLLNNKLGLNVSFFKRAINDLFLDRPLDPSTNGTLTQFNIGDMETEGVEVDLNYTPIKNDNFSWKIGGNFYADENTVTKLGAGLEVVPFATRLGVTNAAIAGEPFGVFYGTAIARDENGNFLVNGSDGTYLQDNEPSILGDPNADWTSSLRNTFKYKNLNFSFQWQYRHGGDVFSATASTLLGRGLIDVGIDRDSNFILPGVLPDGSQNNLVITSAELFFSVNGTTNELRIFDGSTIRLNEVSFGYDFSDKMLSKTPLGALSINFVGNNLWYRAVNMPKDANYDTNSSSSGSGNGQGIDLFTGPTSKQYGFSIKASF